MARRITPPATPPATPETPAPPVAPETPAPATSGALLRVRALGGQARRRAGYAFGPEPVELVVADLDDAQIAAINSDPLLTTELVHTQMAQAGGDT